MVGVFCSSFEVYPYRNRARTPNIKSLILVLEFIDIHSWFISQCCYLSMNLMIMMLVLNKCRSIIQLLSMLITIANCIRLLKYFLSTLHTYSFRILSALYLKVLEIFLRVLFRIFQKCSFSKPFSLKLQNIAYI